MRLIADLHIHSVYARATSRYSLIPYLTQAAKKKGINLLGTGDFTHPKWFEHLKSHLKPHGDDSGVYVHDDVYFMLSTEICTREVRKDGVKRVHHVVHAPSFESVAQINDVLAKYGDLGEDGRPLLNITPAELIELVRGVDPRCVIYPAHAWTPWFGVFGSKSGYRDMEDAYQDQAVHVWALETGLSSDPPMNWLISDLDKYSLISNSDAHSPGKLGREANVLNVEKLNYDNIIEALKSRKGFEKTFEFYPEEGKYHYDGHRKCHVWMDPYDSLKHNNICPVCRKPLTVGVLHQIVVRADRKMGEKPSAAVPFQHIIPLRTLLSKALHCGEMTKTVETQYDYLVRYFGSELGVFEATPEQIRLAVNGVVRDALLRAITGSVAWRPGYDGVFGELLLDQKTDDQPKEQSNLSDFFT